jgi:hypothetical protein
MPSLRRFPPPGRLKNAESFIVKDATGQPVAYVHFEDEPTRQRTAKRVIAE